MHECYAKFHAWLFLETYVGSAVSFLQFLTQSVTVFLITPFLLTLDWCFVLTSNACIPRVRRSRSSWRCCRYSMGVEGWYRRGWQIVFHQTICQLVRLAPKDMENGEFQEAYSTGKYTPCLIYSIRFANGFHLLDQPFNYVLPLHLLNCFYHLLPVSSQPLVCFMEDPIIISFP